MGMTNFDVIGIAGDWHSDANWAVKCLNRFADAGVTEILHVGDFNFMNDARGIDFLDALDVLAEKFGITIWVTLGNHEDYAMVASFVPHPVHAGWVYDTRWNNILVAERGTRWEWNGVTFVSLGGANSVNRYSLTPNVDWWSEEQISIGDVYRTIEGGHADVMITHDSPAGVSLWEDNINAAGGWSLEALAYASGSRDQLRFAVDAVKPKVLFHGHYHFYTNQVVTLSDWDNVDYVFRNIGLEMNGNQNNIGLFALPTKEFTPLEV